MASLSAKQRQFLRGLAHPLSPVVRVGKGGATAAVIAETKKSLEAHELIKVRIEVDESDERRAGARGADERRKPRGAERARGRRLGGEAPPRPPPDTPPPAPRRAGRRGP